MKNLRNVRACLLSVLGLVAAPVCSQVKTGEVVSVTAGPGSQAGAGVSGSRVSPTNLGVSAVTLQSLSLQSVGAFSPRPDVPVQAVVEGIGPLASAIVEAVPAQSGEPTALEKLQSTVKDFSRPDADRGLSLQRLFFGESGRGDVEAEGGASSRGERIVGWLLGMSPADREAAMLWRRIRAYAGKTQEDARLELIPYLDVLWEKGLIKEEDFHSWGGALAAAGMLATKREDVFKLLSPRVSPDEWPLQNVRSRELLAWVWGKAPQSGKIRMQLGKNPATPPGVLAALAQDRAAGVREEVARNPSTPPEVLLRFVKSPDDDPKYQYVRGHAAQNASLPVEGVLALLRDGDPIERAGLGANRAVPVELLTRLSGSGDAKDRWFAARHPSTPVERLRALALDEVEMVQRGVAGNPSTPPDVLLEFSKEAESGGFYSLMISALAGNPSTPPDLLKKMARMGDALREIIADNPSTPPEVLRSLARSRSENLRRQVAFNPALPLDMFRRLDKDRSSLVRERLRFNKAFPKDALGRPAWDFPTPRLDDVGLRRVVEETSEALRFNKRLVYGALEKLGVSVRPEEPGAKADPAESAPFSTLWEERQEAGFPPFKNIVVDVRGSRGGRGDVAAGYLTAMDLLEKAKRAKASGLGGDFKITFMMDRDSQRILSGLHGKPVMEGDSAFDGAFEFHDLYSLPNSFPPADLYLALAKPSGALSHVSDLTPVGGRWSLRRLGKLLRLSSGGIPIDEKTVVVVQTVLGNTENPNSRNPFGLLKVGRREFRLLPAGLSPQESGVYSDHVAWSLRGKTAKQVRDFLIAALPTVSNERDRTVLEGILSGSLLSGAEPGLVYGVTSPSVKKQFEGYLKGLSESAETSGKSYVLITPSGFKKENISDKKLRGRVLVVAADKKVRSLKAKPGKIYVVKTQGLPHQVFVGLMAYSRPPPVVAGDGAMSAAVVLGRPFVMTRVEWNERNIENFKDRLLALENRPAMRSLLESVYGEKLDLSRALELKACSARFKEMSSALPGFTGNLMSAAAAAASALDESIPVDLLLPRLPDSALRMDVLLDRSLRGEGRAKELFAREYLRTDAESRRRLDARILGGEFRYKLGVFVLRLEEFLSGLLG